MKFEINVKGATYSNALFQRLSAKDIKFEKVDFKYSIFDNCYLRNCVFDSCDFTGCKFIGSNLPGTKFEGCKFDYCLFEKTFIDSEIIESSAPAFENLKQKFARTLRLNYQSVGDPDSVNRAILFELAAKGEHLHKAWASNEAYYRKKYKGGTRVLYFFRWLRFYFLDFLWGHGESVTKFTRSIFLFWFLMALVDYLYYGKLSIWESVINMPGFFLGSIEPDGYSKVYISFISFVRLISIGLLISIIVKRFNKR